MGSYILSNYNKDSSKTLSTAWTHISDVGKNKKGSQLTLQDYLSVEDRYLGFFAELFSSSGINNFILRWFEDNRYLQFQLEPAGKCFVKIPQPWFTYTAAETYSADSFGDLLRLGLRQLIVFEAVAGDFFVRSFDDMYVYIETPDSVDLPDFAQVHHLSLGKYEKYQHAMPQFIDDL